MLKAYTDKPHFLVGSADYFAPAGPDHNGRFNNVMEKNGYELYQRDPQGFTALRDEQHARFFSVFSKFARLNQLPAQKRSPELVYAADGSLSIHDRSSNQLITVFSRFTNPYRGGEIAAHIWHYGQEMDGQAHPNRSFYQSQWAFEGNGDCFYDPYRDVFWAGFHPRPSARTAQTGRSDLRAHKQLHEKTGVDVVSLRNRKPFYHLDTAMAPLSLGHMMVCFDGIHKSYRASFMKAAFQDFGLNPKDYLIEVSRADADKFACNLRCIDRHIIMPDCSVELQDTLKSKGYDVMTVSMSAFIAGGGAVHCLTNPTAEARWRGGYHRNINLIPD